MFTSKKKLPLDEKQGKNVLVSAHSNSPRSIVLFIGQWTKEGRTQGDVFGLEYPRVNHLFYEMESGK